MSYLTAVVKEALRMDPPVSMAMREVIAPIKVSCKKSLSLILLWV